MKKGCLYFVGCILLIIGAANTVFWYQNGPGNRYDVIRLEREIATDLPVGTKKAEVRSWLTSNDFDVYEMNENPAETIVGGRKYNTRSEIVCSYDALVTFAFDKQDRLIRSGAKEFSACL